MVDVIIVTAVLWLSPPDGADSTEHIDCHSPSVVLLAATPVRPDYNRHDTRYTLPVSVDVSVRVSVSMSVRVSVSVLVDVCV